MRNNHFFLLYIVVFLLSLGHHLIVLHPLAVEDLCPRPPPLEQRPVSPLQDESISKENTCRVAVTNSKLFHLETLESVASQFPLKYLNLPSSCNTIVFDYHIMKRNNFASWVSYFRDSLQGKDVSYLSVHDDSGRQHVRARRIGELKIHEEPNTTQDFRPILNASSVDKVTYDAQIEASCYCNGGRLNNHGDKWLQQDETRTCIFHQTCPGVENHPRAIWVSPHHQHYYIPSMLPNTTTNEEHDTKGPKPLCIVGSTERRNWSFIRDFLAKGETKTSNVRFRIMSGGKFPSELKAYTNITTLSTVKRFVKFHQAVAQCGAILVLLTKNGQSEYFPIRKSPQRLSGQVTLIIAYKLPFVIHEDLYELYKQHLPVGVPFATHNDTVESFRHAMNEFLDKLDEWHAPAREA